MKILHTSAAMTRLAVAALSTCTMLAGPVMAQRMGQPEQSPATSNDSRQGGTPTSRDAWITAKVKAALLADTQVRGLALDVDTRDGVVTLRGTAVTQAEIDELAEDLDATGEFRGIRIGRMHLRFSSIASRSWVRPFLSMPLASALDDLRAEGHRMHAGLPWLARALPARAEVFMEWALAQHAHHAQSGQGEGLRPATSAMRWMPSPACGINLAERCPPEFLVWYRGGIGRAG